MTDVNATAAAILGLLHEGPMTGAQVINAASSRLSGFWTTTRSQVYRELDRLADLGYVLEGKVGARNSLPFSISKKGRRAFGAWLNEPAGNDQLRNPLMLRAAFGNLHTPRQLENLYEERIAYHTEVLLKLRNQLDEAIFNRADGFTIATLRYAITYNRSALNWLKAAPVHMYDAPEAENE